MQIYSDHAIYGTFPDSAMIACKLRQFTRRGRNRRLPRAAFAFRLTAKHTATVPVVIAKFAQEVEIKYGVMAAGAVLSAIPAIIVLLLAQRHVVKGLTAGAVK